MFLINQSSSKRSLGFIVVPEYPEKYTDKEILLSLLMASLKKSYGDLGSNRWKEIFDVLQEIGCGIGENAFLISVSSFINKSSDDSLCKLADRYTYDYFSEEKFLVINDILTAFEEIAHPLKEDSQEYIRLKHIITKNMLSKEEVRYVDYLIKEYGYWGAIQEIKLSTRYNTEKLPFSVMLIFLYEDLKKIDSGLISVLIQQLRNGSILASGSYSQSSRFELQDIPKTNWQHFSFNWKKSSCYKGNEQVFNMTLEAVSKQENHNYSNLVFKLAKMKKEKLTSPRSFIITQVTKDYDRGKRFDDFYNKDQYKVAQEYEMLLKAKYPDHKYNTAQIVRLIRETLKKIDKGNFATPRRGRIIR